MVDKTIQEFTPEKTTVVGTDTVLIQEAGGGDYTFATVLNLVLDILAAANPVVIGSTLDVSGAIEVASRTTFGIGGFWDAASGGNNRGIKIGGAGLFPTDGDGDASNDTVDIGTAAAAFKNLYLSGGAYIGGTAAANLLDDYEEGTWTPVIGGGSCTNLTGKYTKVGNQVTVTLSVMNGALTSATTAIITGLPFTCGGERSATGAVAFYNLLAADNPLGYIPINASQINFISTNASSSWTTQNFSNSTGVYFNFSATYFV